MYFISAVCAASQNRKMVSMRPTEAVGSRAMFADSTEMVLVEASPAPVVLFLQGCSPCTRTSRAKLVHLLLCCLGSDLAASSTGQAAGRPCRLTRSVSSVLERSRMPFVPASPLPRVFLRQLADFCPKLLSTSCPVHTRQVHVVPLFCALSWPVASPHRPGARRSQRERAQFCMDANMWRRKREICHRGQDLPIFSQNVVLEKKTMQSVKKRQIGASGLGSAAFASTSE